MNELPRITVPDGVHPWSTVYAMAHADIPESWLLVGGLMVQVHAMLGGLSVRPTTDADMLVDLISDRRGVNHLRTVLERRAFRIEPGTLTGYTTRMVAPNGDVVDVLVADHLPKHLMGDAVMGGGRVLSMPGGAQAIERSMEVQLVDGDEPAIIRVPDLLGALMLKSAAWSVDHAGY